MTHGWAARVAWISACLVFAAMDSANATPLSKPEVLKLVRRHVEDHRVLAVVQELGVDFKLTPEVVEEFRAAGATPALLAKLRGLLNSEDSGGPKAQVDVTPPARTTSQGTSASSTFGPQATASGPSLESMPPDSTDRYRNIAVVPAPTQGPVVVDAGGKLAQIRPLLEKAEALVNDADIRGAQLLLAKAIEMDPGEPQVWKAFKRLELDLIVRAETLLADGQVPRALREFQFVITTNPESALAYNGMGLALLKMKNYDDALAAFEKALSLDPANARYRQALNEVRLRQKAAKALEKTGQENLKEMVGEPTGRKKGQ